MSDTVRVSQSAAGPGHEQADDAQKGLKVSTYDRAASMLLALLLVIGFFVLLLLLIVLTRRVMASRHVVPIEFLEPGGAEGRLGTEKGFEEPTMEEVQDLVEPDFDDTIDAITTTVSSKLAHLENLQFGASGAGAGGNLDRGPGGEGDADVIPRRERWEIRYDCETREAYADQLEFFGIELGAFGGGKPTVEYASNLTAAKPDGRTGTPASEERLYMVWQGGPLLRAARELLSAAGIEVRGRILVQFLPPEVEQMLARVERAHAGDREVTEIRKTVFGVRRGGEGYEFYVIDQTFRYPR